jgi:peptidoglycan/LPS O-acetylase OafA/YrhL
LYLWHVAVIAMLTDRLKSAPGGVLLVLAVVLSAALTAFSWYAVEQPFLRMKRRIDHGPGAGPALPGP